MYRDLPFPWGQPGEVAVWGRGGGDGPRGEFGGDGVGAESDHPAQLATAERDGHPVRIGAEAATPEETFETVAAGLGVHLLAAGNAAIYARPDITCRPVRGLSPCSLTIAWRHGDRRPQVHAFVAACLDAAALAAPPRSRLSRPD